MKWFVNQNNRIHGPYDQTELAGILKNLGSQVSSAHVWTRGLENWMNADKWNSSLNPQKSSMMNSSVSTEKTQTSKTATASPTLYKVQYNFIDQPLMTKEELINFTLRQDDISKLSIFDPKQKVWKEVYAVPEVAETLGLTRRKNARVPILAQFQGNATSRDVKLNCRVVTMSVGGMGVTDVFDLMIGDTIRGQITSPHFFNPLKVEAEVTYTGNDGYVGLKFIQINDETAALITEYVKKFSADKE